LARWWKARRLPGKGVKTRFGPLVIYRRKPVHNLGRIKPSPTVKRPRLALAALFYRDP